MVRGSLIFFPNLGADSLCIKTMDAEAVLLAPGKELAKQVSELRTEVVTLREQSELLRNMHYDSLFSFLL